MRLLFVEDSADDTELTVAELRRFGFDFEMQRVDTVAELHAALRDQSWSAVISDFHLPQFNGADALRIVREYDTEAPFLIVSGMVGEELAVDVVRAGANDYVMKDRLQRLGPSLERELRDVQTRHERRMFFDALRRSEDRYRRIFEKAPIGVATSMADGTLMAVNERLAALLGFSTDAMIGEPISRFMHPGDLPDAPAHGQREQRFLTKQGTIVWTTLTTAPILGSDETIEQVVWLVEDTTERKRNEQELQLRAAQQMAISDFGNAALRGEPIETLLEQMATAVTQLLDSDLCAILQEIDGKFKLVGGKGWTDEIMTRTFTGAMAQYTLDVGAPVVVHDLAGETRFVPPARLLDLGVVSGVTVPIGTGRIAAWGVLSVHSRTPRHFHAHEVEFLRAIAIVLAQAIERDRVDQQLVLHAAQQSAVAELSRVALHSVNEAVEIACGIVEDVLEVEQATYFALDENARLRYRAGHRWPDGTLNDIAIGSSSPIHGALLRNEGLIIYDHDGGGSTIAVPVASIACRFGVLTARGKRGSSFIESDLEFLQSVANIVAESMERERAATALDASRERYREVIEGASEVIFTLAPNGQFLSLNAAFEQTTGWSTVEWIGRNCLDLIHADDVERTRAMLKTIVEKGTPMATELRINGRYGTVVLAITSFAKREHGRTRTVYGFGRDVTEARRNENVRNELTRSLQLLLESTVEGIVAVDLEGRCTLSNNAAARTIGRPPEDLLGVPLHDLLHHEQCRNRSCPIAQLAEGKEIQPGSKETVWREDGSSVPIEYSAAPIIDGGVRVGVVISFIDISERLQLEMKLEQADRLTSLGRMAATIAHEFNNVLMSISPFVEVVRRGKSVERSLDHISRAVKRGKRITEEILRFTRHTQLQRAPFEVLPWIENIVLEGRSLVPPNCRIESTIDDAGLVIDGDANQLQQIFTNLILNARDAMPEGGTLTIDARREPPNARLPYGMLEHPERFVHCIVSDTGYGMPPETMRHIYEPLFTTKRHGTGLGLAVAHQVVQRHGGEIFVESTVGLGTTFHIFLPLAITEDTMTSPTEVTTPATSEGRYVLLVEDDSSIAEGLAALLELEGLRVGVAETGAAAIDAIDHVTPDVVVLDVGLPDMEGTNVYAALTAKMPGLPVIFSTGQADRARLDGLLDQPHVGYLLKPYECNSLLRAIQEVLPN